MMRRIQILDWRQERIGKSARSFKSSKISRLLWCGSDPHEWPPYSSIHWINHYCVKGLRTVPVNCLISCYCERTCRQAGFNPIGWAGALMLKRGSMMSHQNAPTTVHPRKRIHYSREPDRVQAKACASV